MRKKALPILLLALLILIPFWDLIWLPEGQIIAGKDLSYLFLPWWHFARQSLAQGELPLWNPYLFSGVPFIANPQPALFYPPTWLILVLTPTRAAGVLLLLHLWLAGVGMYGWLRSEKADRAGAFLGAVVFACSGYFFARAYAGHLGVVMTQAWLPTILWITNQVMIKSRWRWAMLGGVPIALSLLAGHTASFYYVLLILGAYVLHLTWERWRKEQRWTAWLRGLVPAAVMVIVGVGLAAVQLIPTLQFLRLSTRQEASYSFATTYSWSPGYLLTLLVPNFFGEPVHIGYWGDGVYEELIFYVGVLPLFLALLMGPRLRHRRAPLLVGLAGVGLLLALGPFTILHRLAYTFLPLFRAARAPARAGFLFTFAAAALAGLALTRLQRAPEETLSRLRRWTGGPIPLLIIGLAVATTLAGFFLFALQRDSNPEVGRLWHVANNTALFLLFFLLTVGLIKTWQAGRLSSHWMIPLTIGLVLIDLWSLGRPLVRAVPVTESEYWRGVLELTGGEGRVLPWGLSIFEQNQGMDLELESIFGYDPLELKRYWQLTTSVPDPQARAYDLLHAQYLVAGQGIDFPEGENPPRYVGNQGGAWVYERPTVLPRAWLVHRVEVLEGDALLARLNDPTFSPETVGLLEEEPGCVLADADEAEGVTVVRRGNNRVEVEVAAAAPGLLILSEVHYPGWRATVDGEPVPVLRVDHALRGVCVPAGAHQVALTFAPTSLLVGAGISLLSLILVSSVGLPYLMIWMRRRGA